MARTSYKTFLMHKKAGEGNTWEKLVDVKEIPDLGQAPDTIDITTLSDGQKRYLADILDTGGGLEFNANYDLADYTKLKALEHKSEDYAVWLGGTETGGVLTPDGSEGKFEFQGELTVWLKGVGVSAAHDMGISIAPSTEIKQTATVAGSGE